MNLKPVDPPPARRRAFTLLELMTVMAIIGILSSIILPLSSSIRIKALRAKTRGQLSQWTIAMEMFNAEYGSYPNITGPYTGGRSSAPGVLNADKFAVALTGRKLDGDSTALSGPSVGSAQKVGNLRLISFYNIGAGEIDLDSSPVELLDYFKNKEIGVLTDKNGDGIINATDVAGAPPAVSAGSGPSLGSKGKYTPDTTVDINLSKGVYSPVIFYSPGFGNTDNAPIEAEDAVFSWK